MKKVIYLLVFTLSMFILDSSINAWNEYAIGQEVEYNGIKFYVIKNSGTEEDSVTMLKAEPLTVDEVTTYGAGHINRYTTNSQGVTYNRNGYGGMTYYSSDTCKLGTGTGCTSDYEDSDIKYAVDNWANDKFTEGVLKADTLGYKARLLTYEELTTTLGYTPAAKDVTSMNLNSENTPSWVYNSNYYYWTMSPYQDEASRVWDINYTGDAGADEIYPHYACVVRPVVTFSKSALGDIDNSDENNNQDIVPDDKDNDNITPSNNEDTKNELKTSVKVDNTYMSKSIVIIILGFISAGLGIFAYYKFSNKKK